MNWLNRAAITVLVYNKLLKTGSLDNSRVFIGLAIMGYEPLYHALRTNMVSVRVIFF